MPDDRCKHAGEPETTRHHLPSSTAGPASSTPVCWYSTASHARTHPIIFAPQKRMRAITAAFRSVSILGGWGGSVHRFRALVTPRQHQLVRCLVLRSSNADVKVPALRLICENGKQLGVMSYAEAKQVASKRSLQLFEVSSTSDPPVYKLRAAEVAEKSLAAETVQAMPDKAAKKKPKKDKRLKEVRITDRCDPRDAETKMRTARKFLIKGHPVRLAALNSGRLNSTGDKTVAQVLVEDIASSCSDIAALGRLTGAVDLRAEPGTHSKNALGLVALMLTPKKSNDGADFS